MKKLLLLATFLMLTTLGVSSPAFAATPPSDPTTNCGGPADINQNANNGEPVTPAINRQCDPAINGTGSKFCSNPQVTASNCSLVADFIQPAVDFLSVLFGIAVVGSIIYGGIEYSSSGGDPSKAASGKNRIRNAIIALVAYVFLVAAMNFIIPGGVF